MKFKEYSDQAFDSSEISSMNQRLIGALNDLFLSPEDGLQKIRKVLHTFGLDMPALYDADTEGDEIVFELGKLDSPEETNAGLYLYIIYYLEDNDSYIFYAEIMDEIELDKLLSDEDEELEEF
jgi:hypothetical protein